MLTRACAGDAVRVVRVVRQHVMRQGRVDVRIGPLAQLARHHEREHASQVGLVGQRQQLEQHADVFVVRLRARRPARRAPSADVSACCSARWIRRSTSRTWSRYSSEPRAIGARRCRARASARSSATKSRMLRSSRMRARALLGGVAAAEHPLEQDARVDLHRQRRRRRLPAQRVGVRAAVAGRARAEQRGEVLGGHLERRERRVLADLLGDDLIDRDAEPEVGPSVRFGVTPGASDAGAPAWLVLNPPSGRRGC